MNLRREILNEHSKVQTLKIAGWVGNDKKRFNELMKLFLHDEYRVVQRSAYPISIISERHPELAEANIHLMIIRLYDKDTHVAVRRNVIRILQFITIPKKLHAKVLNFCMQYLSDPNETVAVRCFSMTVLAKLAAEYPEIKNELILTIEKYFKNPTAGMRVRIRRILKELNSV
jgi:hypothetical protein